MGGTREGWAVKPLRIIVSIVLILLGAIMLNDEVVKPLSEWGADIEAKRQEIGEIRRTVQCRNDSLSRAPWWRTTSADFVDARYQDRDASMTIDALRRDALYLFNHKPLGLPLTLGERRDKKELEAALSESR